MTEMEKILKGNYQAHAVGSYNSDVMDTFGNGVKAGEDIDNFTLVEIVYDPATGEETCVQLTDVANEGLLACTPETRHFEFEKMDSFFNGKVEPLKDVPEFTNFMIKFSDTPVLGLLAGLILTAIIQSSSASVGILQAFCKTGVSTSKNPCLI